MSKAILVIDMPESCDKCPFLFRHEEERWCWIKSRNSFTTKPSWCPLQPILEKIDIPDFDDNIKAKNENAEEVGIYMYDRGHYRGYNLCIDKITRGRRLDCSLYEDYCDLPQEIIDEVCKPFIIDKE